MFKLVLFVACTLFLSSSFGEALTCYHCYDSFTKTPVAGSIGGREFGDKLVKMVRCDKNQNLWNTWNCPAKFPICVIVHGKVADHYEVVRTCAENDFCSKYVPPPGVKVTSCRECNTTMCNDYERIDPPVEPDPLFTFNININLKLNKYTVVSSDDEY